MKIQTIAEAEAALLPYVPLVAQLTGKDTTLTRIRPLMALVGNPQDRLRVVHIAGTSGKTSTAYYMAALLGATGHSVGLTVSPHVDSIAERLQLNGRPLPEAEFCALLGEFLELVARAPEQPSYFELLYAFALWVFARQEVGYAVIETGMGGLYDATNVATRADKVCIITDIGFDHMHILGYTLPEIASQKIGIVHKGNQVFMYQQAPEIMDVVERWVAQQPAELHTTTEAAERRQAGDYLTDLPPYQQRNWLLAYYVYNYLAGRDNLPNVTPQALRASQAVQVPGRMDARQIDGKTIVMDGAHNEQKMTAFVASFRVLYPEARPVILIALKEGKEYQAVVPVLAGLASRVIVTTFATSQDLPARSVDPQLLADAFIRQTAQAPIPVEVVTDHRQAWQTFIASPESIGIVTGSFYLLSQLRKLPA